MIAGRKSTGFRIKGRDQSAFIMSGTKQKVNNLAVKLLELGKRHSWSILTADHQEKR